MGFKAPAESSTLGDRGYSASTWASGWHGAKLLEVVAIKHFCDDADRVDHHLSFAVPIGSKVVPLCGLYLRSYQVIPQNGTTLEPMGSCDFRTSGFRRKSLNKDGPTVEARIKLQASLDASSTIQRTQDPLIKEYTLHKSYYYIRLLKIKYISELRCIGFSGYMCYPARL